MVLEEVEVSQITNVVVNGLKRILNISNPLEMPLDMLCEFGSL